MSKDGRNAPNGIDSESTNAVSETVRDQISITSDTRYLSVIRDFISRMIRQSPLPAEEGNKVILAVDEAVTNIIEHGYDNVPSGPIDIQVEFDSSLFRVIETIRDPDIMEHVRLGRKKGLGIFLMRQIMDEVRYVFREGLKNEVTLTKYIRRQPT
jgi:serine/threonine-protein kinase RsbW